MSNEMGPAWVKEQAERQAKLNELYREDGRDDPKHPYHSLFTGLAKQSEENQAWLKKEHKRKKPDQEK
tara:strand:+ start:594 stop:797 length:204 start_codon:yes stop_codon:yes gene_type:complete